MRARPQIESSPTVGEGSNVDPDWWPDDSWRIYTKFDRAATRNLPHKYIGNSVVVHGEILTLYMYESLLDADPYRPLIPIGEFGLTVNEWNKTSRWNRYRWMPCPQLACFDVWFEGSHSKGGVVSNPTRREFMVPEVYLEIPDLSIPRSTVQVGDQPNTLRWWYRDKSPTTSGLYIQKVGAYCPSADVTTTNTNPGDPMYGVPDGIVNQADLSFYVERWMMEAQ